MPVPRRSALPTLLFLVAGFGAFAACDDPITPNARRLGPEPIVEKTTETGALLGRDHTEGPVCVRPFCVVLDGVYGGDSYRTRFDAPGADYCKLELEVTDGTRRLPMTSRG